MKFTDGMRVTPITNPEGTKTLFTIEFWHRTQREGAPKWGHCTETYATRDEALEVMADLLNGN